jgi:hypothetical protein
MKYWITTESGRTVLLEVAVQQTVSWAEFVARPEVTDLGEAVIDVTPDGMPDRFSEEMRMACQLREMGLRREIPETGAPKYFKLKAEDDEELSDIDADAIDLGLCAEPSED